MRPQAPAPRVQTARDLTSRSFPRDTRKIYYPADIPAAFQTGHRRFQAERPSTVDAHKRQQHLDNGFVADTLSYYPRIRENPSARETREQKARETAGSTIELPLVGQGKRIVRPPYRKRSGFGVFQPRDDRNVAPKNVASPLRAMDFDQDGITTLQSVFDASEQLSEEDFVLEVFKRQNAAQLQPNERTKLAQELRKLFREADINSLGYLTWETLSTHLFHTSGRPELRLRVNVAVLNVSLLVQDAQLPGQDAAVCKYKADSATHTVKLSAEIQGMYYFAEVDQVLLQHELESGFWMLDASTNKMLRQTPSVISTGRIVDAMFWSTGRYVITASSSPVISLYDIDQLKLRQQIPCDGMQMALAGHADASARHLYSASAMGQVHVWNLDSLTRAYSFFDKGHEVCSNLTVVDTMDQLAAACLDGKIYMIDLHLCQVSKTLSGHRQGVSALRFSGENGYLVSGGVDQSIHVWNPHVETKIGSLLGHRHQLIGVEVAPNSPQIVSADESGTVKIWDLRKFSCLQTISRDAYAKDQDTLRIRNRPMKAMSYIASRRRIAIAHSAIYFLDESAAKSGKESFRRPSSPTAASSDKTSVHPKTTGFALEYHQDRDNESRVPLAVIVHDLAQCIVAVMAHHIATWSLADGMLAYWAPSGLDFEITSAVDVDNQHSCFVGSERGTIARLILPGAAVIMHKKVCQFEVASLKWVAGVRYLVCSLGEVGNILVVRSESLETVYTLNHWRGVQSVLGRESTWSLTSDSSALPCLQDLFVPAHLRSFFQSNNELDWLKRLFISADLSSDDTMVDTERLFDALDRVLPSFPEDKPPTSRAPPGDAALGARTSFSSFLEEVKRRLQISQDGGTQCDAERKLFEISCMDVNASTLQLVSRSSASGSFCVWNLRNGAVVTAGKSAVAGRGDCQSSADHLGFPLSGSAQDTPQCLSQARFLEPLPFFVMVSGCECSSISLWSTVALPPAFPHPFQCIIDCKHSGFRARSCSDASPSDDHDIDASEPGCLVTTLTWYIDPSSDEMLIAVGDDRGVITLYDLEPVNAFVSRINGSAGCESQHPVSVGAASTLLPSTLLSIKCEWQTNEPTPFRSLTTTASTQTTGGKQKHGQAMLVLISDSGSISIWGVQGQCFGKLGDHLAIDPLSSRNRVGVATWSMSSRANTAQKLECEGATTQMEANGTNTALLHHAWSEAESLLQSGSDDMGVEENNQPILPPSSGKARVRAAILSQLVHQR